MKTLNKIAVYCGSNFGSTPDYYEAAKLMGQTLAKQNIELVYGGGNVGLMGTIADSTLNNGGVVTGVIPTFLKKKKSPIRVLLSSSKPQTWQHENIK